ncbi:hypothetical protein DFH28DRAFT_213642 [Melampsora americana]|nr:hypothetical protein DFH28DRAFT_213642 [Melampsora americana]
MKYPSYRRCSQSSLVHQDHLILKVLTLSYFKLCLLMERLPEAYQRSVFASFVAYRYIFQYGLSASAVDFFHFFSRFKQGGVIAQE